MIADLGCPDHSADMPSVDAAPSLTSLPLELLSRLLGCVPECWYTACYRPAIAEASPIHSDATHSEAFVVLLPAAATVCTSFRRALLASNRIALSLSGLRPPPQDWRGIASIVGARRRLRPDVLAFYDCNLKPDVLAALLRGCSPLSVLSIRRCHSLAGGETSTLSSLDTLPTGGTVRGTVPQRLHPCASEFASMCTRGCVPLHQRLQPCASEAASPHTPSLPPCASSLRPCAVQACANSATLRAGACAAVRRPEHAPRRGARGGAAARASALARGRMPYRGSNTSLSRQGLPHTVCSSHEWASPWSTYSLADKVPHTVCYSPCGPRHGQCRLRLRRLIALLPRMPELRCLLLGGAVVEEVRGASSDCRMAVRVGTREQAARGCTYEPWL